MLTLPSVASDQPTLRSIGVPDGCTACGSARLIRLDLSLTDGTPVVFVSCRGCERRSYHGPDGTLGVRDVLARTVKPGKGSVPERARA